ncbi:PREDICTED: uncharacterized protein LOC109581373 [Amphimedon queenslandica]|uniref:Uncharacterized protein n=1 Tax=Amphimedon queenslandica TaxID=400682 RepID=A0AAN0J2N3_AMPQE|nr:PREDICTED: uncharacterized protein LOC109581373 [Amphimedon queenslandica]|eukprot:XP_019850998.1 PREDICTED: uncharacterized protein LOC109581373 [Amphimedon queenslandica]
MATASDSSSPEYATLKEMFGALVDNLVANAPVIAPLNNHLLSSGLIPEAAFNTVQYLGPGSTPYDRCNSMLTPVLAKVESNPACFNSLIKSLEKVKLDDIVVKLKDKLKSRKRACEGQKEKERNDTQTDSESTSTDEEVDPLPFPLVSIPPDLSYTTIGKMTEDLEFLSIDVAATILLDQELSSLFAPSSSRPHLQQFCEQVFNYVKYHRRSYPSEVDEEPESEESEEKPHDLSPDDISRVFEVGIFFLAILALFEAKTEILKVAVSSEKQHKANLLHHASKHGWVSVIDALIKQHGFDPASTDAINQTAVHYAAKHAEYEAFKILVTNHNCDPMCRNSKGETPLLFAIESGSIEIVKYYKTLPLGCDGNTPYNDW